MLGLQRVQVPERLVGHRGAVIGSNQRLHKVIPCRGRAGCEPVQRSLAATRPARCLSAPLSLTGGPARDVKRLVAGGNTW